MFADVDAIVSFIAVGVSVTAVVIACSCEYCCMVDVFVVVDDVNDDADADADDDCVPIVIADDKEVTCGGDGVEEDTEPEKL